MLGMKIDCPCCGGEIDARHTEGLSTTLRRMYFVCEDCGYRTPAGFEILHSLSASSRSRAGVSLEVKPSLMLRGPVNARTTLARENRP
ncbi:ogr/delta-like zinc finger family protein [Caballeronia mineralivorans PML1(12)]|uniref:Ogr/delta-like zinc finger family protein n=1 Tax=Caballeronia mineralivorans PML1(12) TaxID=908627 RepID=A0A0J1CKM3_9BURK|nr:ogr/Delta-like zinc finger family protein [Caballeronia mineralivorans]KLU21079.1 ogr/delta-like zinc finger family protein [Caballeronia mineralivorans PML1(12)]